MKYTRPPRVDYSKQEIIKDYLDGEGLVSISRRFRVHDRVIKDLLVEAGVFRTRSEAQRMRWAKTTPEQLRQRGIRHAKTVQKRAKLSSLEKRFLRIFKEVGIDVIPHYALDIFNIDFAIPEAKLAIEVDSRWHGYSTNIAKEIKKDTFLKDRGWKVLRFRDHRTRGFNFDKIIKVVKSHL